jgi:hypothetical protein
MTQTQKRTLLLAAVLLSLLAVAGLLLVGVVLATGDREVLKSRPWAGTTTGDAGPYTDLQWRKMYASFFDGSGNRGPLRNWEDELAVAQTAPASMAVNVLTGTAVVNGLWVDNAAMVTLTVAANTSGSTRYDLVMITWTTSAQLAYAVLVNGTPGGSCPSVANYQSAPTKWAIPLACVTVANGAGTITTTSIVDKREFARFRTDLGDLVDGVEIGLNGSGDLTEVGMTRTLFVGANELQDLSPAAITYEPLSGQGSPSAGWVLPYTSNSYLSGHIQAPQDISATSPVTITLIWGHTANFAPSQNVAWSITWTLGCECGDSLVTTTFYSKTVNTVAAEADKRQCDVLTSTLLLDPGYYFDYVIGRKGLLVSDSFTASVVLLGVELEYKATD